jgi:signal transduction histidine kinase
MRLAILFAGIVIVLVVVSGVFMYLTVRSDIRAAAQRTFGAHETEHAFVTRSLGSLRWRLLAIDGAIVVVVGVGGLFYARSTLRPIRDNVAAQKRFIADASHDLRTPLAIMKAEFEVALRAPAPAGEARAVLDSGLEEVDRMTGMVDDLLTLSRIDAHQEELASDRFDLAEMAVKTTAKLQALAGKAGVCLEAAAAAAAPVGGDERHVRRALFNVIRNAVEHSPRGGSVEIAALAGKEVSRITVTDHGEGIPADELEHIFDRFYRGDLARPQAHGGSGLGLAIARWALRRMGGDVAVESVAGSGTTVTVTLPTRAA